MKLSIIKQDNVPLIEEEYQEVLKALVELEKLLRQYKSVKLNAADFQLYYKNPKLIKPNRYA